MYMTVGQTVCVREGGLKLPPSPLDFLANINNQSHAAIPKMGVWYAQKWAW